MKVNLTQVLVNLDGKPVTIDGMEGTLGRLCAAALAAPNEQEDKKLSPDNAIARWHLALQCFSSKEIEFTPEQATDIRARLVRNFPVMLAGQACELLK